MKAAGKMPTLRESVMVNAWMCLRQVGFPASSLVDDFLLPRVLEGFAGYAAQKSDKAGRSPLHPAFSRPK
jgi:hypothetical protein